MRCPPRAAFALGLVLAACTDDPSGLDASIVDAAVDAGPAAADAEPRDAEPGDALPPDATLLDAGEADAGEADAGHMDAGLPPLQSGCRLDEPAAQPTLTEISPAPRRGRTFHTAERLPDGRVLIAGGFSGEGGSEPDVEFFDPETETFTTGPARPFGAASAGGVTLADGRVFVEVGRGEPSLLYDAEGGWTATATAPDVSAATHLALADGRVLGIGGLFQGQPDDRVHVYDPEADTWTMILRLPEGRVSPAAVQLPDGRVFVVGGGFRNMRFATALFIDVEARTATPGPVMAEARGSTQVAQLLDRRVLVYGLSVNGLNAEIWDPATNAFRLSSGAPPANVGVQMVRLCDGRVALLGGRVGGDPRADAVTWLFDPRTDRWTSHRSARMPSRQNPSATLLEDGRVLIYGGSLFGQGGPPPHPPGAFLFTPDAPN